MIVSIRGTNGSGKSTLVRSYMKKLVGVEPTTELGKIIGYQGRNRTGNLVSIVGRYETDCGGCDTIKTQDLVIQRVRNAAHFGHCVFEGVIAGDIYGRYKALSDTYKPGEFVFAYLDTPLELCLERVGKRRAAKGKDPTDFNAALVEQKYNNAIRQANKARHEGATVIVLDYKHDVNQLTKLLETGT
jgi:thymidylate kinase